MTEVLGVRLRFDDIHARVSASFGLCGIGMLGRMLDAARPDRRVVRVLRRSDATRLRVMRRSGARWG